MKWLDPAKDFLEKYREELNNAAVADIPYLLTNVEDLSSRFQLALGIAYLLKLKLLIFPAGMRGSLNIDFNGNFFKLFTMSTNISMESPLVIPVVKRNFIEFGETCGLTPEQIDSFEIAIK